MYTIERNIELATTTNKWSGRSRTMIWMALLGTMVSPRFHHDLEAINATFRMHRKLDMPMQKRPACIRNAKPTTRLLDVAKKWSWNHVGNLTFDTIVGTLDLLRDSQATIEKAAHHGWMCDMGTRDNRWMDTVWMLQDNTKTVSLDTPVPKM